MGRAVCATVADSTDTARGRNSGATGSWYPARVGHLAATRQSLLHYALDRWMVREFPGLPFERYCDDIVVHCVSEKQTRYLEKRIAARLGEVGLRLHPDKTKVVY